MPRLTLAPASREADEIFPIGADDVLLVTGGGKGIGAECALALGRATGAKLILLCRSSPETDRELAQNLKRFEAAGLRHHHARADVTDAPGLRAAIAAAENEFGPVTALLHAAGTNTPQLIGALDEAAFRKTVAPKISGARNVLAAIDPKRLRMFVTFGSVIARAGLRGEADYATANEWLTAFTEDFQKLHPQCRCRALEWSVWSGVGMGERLGRIETLMQQGIMPIPVEEGVRRLLEAVNQSAGPVARVVTGRFGEPVTLKLNEPELPLRRFLERKRVFYPGVELIVDAELSATADPYLHDHVVQKQKLLPAVLGLEAMAQAAMALLGRDVMPDFEEVQLVRPIVVPDGRTATIRVAALRRGPDVVEVCVRSEETDFQVDHFRAVCRFGGSGAGFQPADGASSSRNQRGQDARPDRLEACPTTELLPLDPATELYGRILFHTGRFQRLHGYLLLKAKECVAEITAAPDAPWFGPYLPGELVAGDPGARDAALHAIQACIPHRRILPTGIDRLTIHRIEAGPRRVHAKERVREGDNFIFDVEVTDARGEVIETWSGLRLRAVEVLASPASWPEVLLGPYIERRLEELLTESPVNIAVRRTGAARSAGATDFVFAEALGNGSSGVGFQPAQSRARSQVGSPKNPVPPPGRLEACPTTEMLAVKVRIERRADGKPFVPGGRNISAAHAHDLTLAVTGENGVACDLEPIVARTGDEWRDLLGEERHKLAELISRERNESGDSAATRLWTAAECLKKAGLPAEAPLVLTSATADGWVLLRSGALMIASSLATVDGRALALAVAVAMPENVKENRIAPVAAAVA